MKTIIKFAIVALSILMLVGCTSSLQQETIELTIDNWQDYLEIKEDYSYDYNDFDEIISMYKVYNFYLKDGMTFVKGSFPEIAIEYEYDDTYYTFTNVDWENGTFDYSELDDATKSQYLLPDHHESQTKTLYRVRESDGYTSNSLGIIRASYGITLENGETLGSFYSKDSDGEISFSATETFNNLTITRIKGTIEVVK